jgi:hypothetical protein
MIFILLGYHTYTNCLTIYHTMRNQRISRKGVSRRPKSRRGRVSSAHPPQLKTAVSCTHTFRFKASSALTAVQIQAHFLNDLIQVAATTTTAYTIIDTFRIKRVTMWGPMASDLVPVTVSLEWVDAVTQLDSNRALHSDTSMGSNRCAFISCKPPKMTTSVMWQGDSTNPAFILNGPVNTIVDVTLQFTIINNLNGDDNPVAITVAGAAVGQVYMGRLDGPTTGLLVPVSALFT